MNEQARNEQVRGEPLTSFQTAYLGDGLYCYFDGWQVTVYAHNGVCATNTVYFDPGTLKNFESYLGLLKKQMAAERPKQ